MISIRDALRTKNGTKGLGIVTMLILSINIYAFCGANVLNRIKFVDRTLFDILTESWPGHRAFVDSSVGKSLCVISLICIIALWTIRQFYRTRIIIIKHSTMNKELRIDIAFSKSHWCKKYSLTFEPPCDDDLPCFLKEQDIMIESMVKKLSRDKRPVYYCGIAHTPFIFRLGYQLSGKNILFLHEYGRNGKLMNNFTKLKKYDDDRVSFTRPDERSQPNATELLVGIGATSPIQNVELDTIDPTNTMYRSNITIDDELQGYDFFSSEHKIDAYALSTAKHIENLCKQQRFHVIHMAISASTAFTFKLAQRLHTNQIPQIIVYHYRNGYYPWGIIIKENNAQNAILHINPRDNEE